MSPKRGRRSNRLDPYDSNGREYLADQLGWPREELESWIVSSSVKPHLQLWYNICISSPRRFNDAIEWINTGDNGYFYNPQDLEEDLLLMCLGEGVGPEEANEERAAYANDCAKTGSWITQELWARTAWRIVNSNKADDQAFAKVTDKHPASCYAIAIDILCLAFHSIAFRGAASPYEQLINGDYTEVGRVKQIDTGDNACLSENDEASTPSSTEDRNSELADRSSDDDMGKEGSDTDTSSEISEAPVKEDGLQSKEMSGELVDGSTASMDAE